MIKTGAEETVVRLQNRTVIVRKSFFSTVLRQWLRMPGLGMMVGGGGDIGGGTHLPDDLSL